MLKTPTIKRLGSFQFSKIALFARWFKVGPIEKKLQKKHKVKANLYLYDVTSSYLEGENNEEKFQSVQTFKKSAQLENILEKFEDSYIFHK